MPTVSGPVSTFNIGTRGIIDLDDSSSNTPNPTPLQQLSVSVIAPYWINLGLSAKSSVLYHLYDIDAATYQGAEKTRVDNMLDSVNAKVRKYRPHLLFSARWAMVVTWDRVYPIESGNVDTEEITFQVVIATNGINTFLTFNYRDVNLQDITGRSAIIGWKVGQRIEVNEHSNKVSSNKIGIYKGNQDMLSYWFYELTSPGASGTTPELQCIDWYKTNRADAILNLFLNSVFLNYKYDRCPCFSWMMFFDRRFSSYVYLRDGMLCSAILVTFNLFTGTLISKECCYNSITTFIDFDQSRVMLKHPIFISENNINDRLPRKQCCDQSNHCNLYRQYRPSTVCRSGYFTVFGFVFGDPHFETLDGRKYTFNGRGEYVMIKIHNVNETFELQTRTDLAQNENGTLINATIFSGFAGKAEDNSSFQVELSDDREKMSIYCNGRDFTLDFYNNTNFAQLVGGSLSVARVDDTVRIGFTKKSIFISVQVKAKMLAFSSSLPDTYKGQTTGLLGNYNDDPSDDLILPNKNFTEREIFFGFGQKWAVTANTSIFTYRDGKTAADYSHPDFVPIFIDEFSTAEREQASETCNANQACIFDLLATGDRTIALETKTVDENAQVSRTNTEDIPPVVTGNNSIIATVGEPVTIQVSVSDENSGDTPVFRIVDNPSSNFTFNKTDNRGVITWIPTDTKATTISITADDTKKNVSAEPLVVDISICSGCSSNGQCNISKVTEVTLTFKRIGCDCNVGYEGIDCEKETDGCANTPCSVKRNCTDLSPAEEVIFGRTFNCSDCPAGYNYSTDVNECIDINECLDPGQNACNSVGESCMNTLGSYECNCISGYRKVNGHCADINECHDKTDGCQQRCVNQEGNFTCDCFYGYKLSNNSKDCDLTITDPCERNNLTCSYGCSNETGVYKCICKLGYSVTADGNCTDINECDQNICQQQCQNVQGSYTCSCVSGYKLLKDKTTCGACPDLTWGVECVNQCNCGEGSSSCDPANGCVCKTGWKGQLCNEDVNECQVNPLICGTQQTCVNIDGSYTCTCPSGFSKSGDSCINIDECAQAIDTCDHTTSQCEDNNGGYTCACLAGYKDVNGTCININECQTGSSACEQNCNDVEGSYNCFCEIGFVLQTDRRSCKRVVDPCATFQNLNCSYACKVVGGNPSCYCKSGFEIAADKETCIDINECEPAKGLNDCNPPSGCNNTQGGYECSCSVGFKLGNDRRTCEKCEANKWGKDCANDCNCGILGTEECNSFTGCKCKEGWTGSTCSVDINECNDGTKCTGTNQRCINSPGSYRCDCETGYSNVSGVCEDVNECNAAQSCQQLCNNTQGSYTCSCREGFTGSAKCEDINECITGQHKCDQICSNTVGSYRCSCRSGFILDDTNLQKCKVKDACNVTNVCDQICSVDSLGQEFCSCQSGFVLKDDKKSCEDINECNNAPQPCSQNCTNAAPGFTCSCRSGYKLDVDKVTCKECTEGTYGDSCSGTCSCVSENTVSCDKVSGSCTCRTGWNGTNCDLNINECAVNSSLCGQFSTCRDTNGSYVCECDAGYAITNNLCVECSNFKYGINCAETCTCNSANTASCNKTNGVCTCNSGWNGTDCTVDINECAVTPGICQSHANCSNNDGSYSCVCHPGYHLTSSTVCEDLNECLTGEDNCDANADCSNTIGSFTCTCKTGYIGNGTSCIEITTTSTTTEATTTITTTEVTSTLTETTTTAVKTDSTTTAEVSTSTTAETSTTPESTTTAADTTSGSTATEATTASGTVFKLLASLDYNVTNSLDNASSQYYKDLVISVHDGMDKIYKKLVVTYRSVIIISLRTGSLVVEHEVTTNTDDKASEQVAIAIRKIVKGTEPLVIDNATVPVTLYGIQKSPGEWQNFTKDISDACGVYAALGKTCASGQQCEDRDTSFACVPVESTDFMLILGLGIGIPLSILAIAAFVLVLVYGRKARRRSDVSSSDRHSGDDFSSAFSVAIKPRYRSWGRTDQFHPPEQWEESGSENLEPSSFYRENQKQFASNFSWDFLYKTMHPSEEFKIPRPQQVTRPHPLFDKTEEEA